MTTEDPRVRRLRSDYQHMVELGARSDLIDFAVFSGALGFPPERYVVTFKCRGIASIDSQRRPVYSGEHKVALYLDSTYPITPPRMKWLTPIWHPNIEHQPPHRVCIDNTWWAPGRTLDKVVLMLGEMVQYKNYHAEQTLPYPIDPEVASWVLWAQSKGILLRGLPVDSRELKRSERVRMTTNKVQPPAPVLPLSARIKVIEPEDHGAPKPQDGPPTGRRIRIEE